MNQTIKPPPTLPEDEPLDPAMERVRRKMVRLLAVSIGTMVIGVFAVLAAVMWRVTSEDAGGATRQITLQIPAGFETVSVSAAADQVVLYGEIDGNRKVLVFDTETGGLLVDAGIMVGVPADAE